MQQETKPHLTLVLPGGLLETGRLAAVDRVAQRYGLTAYLTTLQNLRLLGVTAENIGPIREELRAAGLTVKAPGMFPVPKVCVGRPYCKLALRDIAGLAESVRIAFGDRTAVKPKIKIAMAACPASCSGAFLADIGVVATRSGYDLHAGGKGGGARPKTGRLLLRGVDPEQVVEAIGALVAFHNQRTVTKQRLYKLLDDPAFPYPPLSA